MIEIIEKEPYFNDSPFTGDCYMYPTYMVKDGKEYFMFNRREPDSHWKLQANEDRKAFLLANDGKYFVFHGFYNDPFEMLKEIAREQYTFTESEENNYYGSIEKSGYLDFHGNLCEVSAAFHYRIYDREMAEKIKEVVHHIHKKEFDKV